MNSESVTIKDIAKELQISPSTVSRALSNSPLVKPETKMAVVKLAKELNYTPNLTALSLKNKSTKTIGIIIPKIVHEFFALVIRGIEEYAYSNGFSVILCSSHNSYEREVIDSNTLLNGRVDGVLACVSGETLNFDHYRKFVDRKIPLVFFDCICNEIPAHKVVIDDFDAGYKATKHLIEQGSDTIAFLGGPSNLLTNQDRLSGYKEALKKSDLIFNKDLVVNIGLGEDFNEGYSVVQKLLARHKFNGLFATTDMLAIGAIKAMKSASIKTPKDIAVIGFSNWEISQFFEPTISTVSQPGFEMGYKSAELLIEQIVTGISNKDQTHVLNTEVVARESSLRIKS